MPKKGGYLLAETSSGFDDQAAVSPNLVHLTKNRPKFQGRNSFNKRNNAKGVTKELRKNAEIVEKDKEEKPSHPPPTSPKPKNEKRTTAATPRNREDNLFLTGQKSTKSPPPPLSPKPKSPRKDNTEKDKKEEIRNRINKKQSSFRLPGLNEIRGKKLNKTPKKESNGKQGPKEEKKSSSIQLVKYEKDVIDDEDGVKSIKTKSPSLDPISKISIQNTDQIQPEPLTKIPNPASPFKDTDRDRDTSIFRRGTSVRVKGSTKEISSDDNRSLRRSFSTTGRDVKSLREKLESGGSTLRRGISRIGSSVSSRTQPMLTKKVSTEECQLISEDPDENTDQLVKIKRAEKEKVEKLEKPPKEKRRISGGKSVNITSGKAQPTVPTYKKLHTSPDSARKYTDVGEGGDSSIHFREQAQETYKKLSTSPVTARKLDVQDSLDELELLDEMYLSGHGKESNAPLLQPTPSSDTDKAESERRTEVALQQQPNCPVLNKQNKESNGNSTVKRRVVRQEENESKKIRAQVVGTTSYGVKTTHVHGPTAKERNAIVESKPTKTLPTTPARANEKLQRDEKTTPNPRKIINDDSDEIAARRKVEFTSRAEGVQNISRNNTRGEGNACHHQEQDVDENNKTQDDNQKGLLLDKNINVQHHERSCLIQPQTSEVDKPYNKQNEHSLYGHGKTIYGDGDTEYGNDRDNLIANENTSVGQSPLKRSYTWNSYKPLRKDKNKQKDFGIVENNYVAGDSKYSPPAVRRSYSIKTYTPSPVRRKVSEDGRLLDKKGCAQRNILSSLSFFNGLTSSKKASKQPTAPVQSNTKTSLKTDQLSTPANSPTTLPAAEDMETTHLYESNFKKSNARKASQDSWLGKSGLFDLEPAPKQKVSLIDEVNEQQQTSSHHHQQQHKHQNTDREQLLNEEDTDDEDSMLDRSLGTKNNNNNNNQNFTSKGDKDKSKKVKMSGLSFKKKYNFEKI